MNDFDKLKISYAKRLKEAAACITSWLEDDDLPSLKDIEILVHGLAGTGETFGYAEVSEVAGKIDDGISRGETEEDLLREQLADLRAVLARD